MSPTAMILWLGLFGVGLLVVTVYSMRRASRTVEDYLVAGRGIGTFVFFFYGAFGIISTWTIYGYAGFMSYSGIAFNVYHLSAGFGIGLVTYWWLGYRLMLVGKMYNFNSPLEALSDRFQTPAIGVVVAGILILFILPYVGLQYAALGAGMQAASPEFDYRWGALFMLILTAVYLGFGGLRSAAWVNVMLGICAVLITFAVFFALYRFLPGGLTGAASQLLEVNPEILSMPGPIGIYTKSFTTGLALAGLLYFAPHMLVGIMGARGKASISVIVWGMPLICVIVYTLICWMSIYYTPILYPGITGKAADAIIQNMIAVHLPKWFGIVFLMGVLSFAISTAGLQLWAAGAFFTNDILLRHINPDLSYSKVRWITFGFLLIVSLLSFGIALWRPDVLALYLTRLAGPGFTMIIPCLAAALYWPRANKYGAISGMLVGTGYLILELFIFKWLRFGMHEVVIPLALNIAILIVVSMLTKPQDRSWSAIRWKENVTKYLKGEKFVINEPNYLHGKKKYMKDFI